MTALLRFAPSPTGGLHLGGLRMALINRLVSRRLGGKWILRIEDTDQKRLVSGSLNDIESSLEWAGLEYDFGPTRGGAHGPYLQSRRLDLYAAHAKNLLQSGYAYRCFCTPQRLADVRERLQKSGLHATYDRACLHLSEEEAIRRVKSGENYVVRIRDDHGPRKSSCVVDMIFGRHVEPSTSRATDTILMKADRFPTYHFASVVDDHVMDITHVIRGEEWLPSLPLHLQLYDAFGWEPPRFAHVPILLNPNGSKMSKRKGDAHVSDYIRKGWEPEAVLNWLALAGWGRDSRDHSSDPKANALSDDTSPILSLRELEQQYDLADLTHRRNILDPSKLEFLNRHYLKAKVSTRSGLESLVERVLPLLRSSFPQSGELINASYVKTILPLLLNLVIQEKMENINNIGIYAPYLFMMEAEFQKFRGAFKPKNSIVPGDPNVICQITHDTILRNDEELNPQTLRRLLREISIQSKVSHADLMYALRAALTGMTVGPSVVDIICLLGRDRTLSRLQSFHQKKEKHTIVSADAPHT